MSRSTTGALNLVALGNPLQGLHIPSDRTGKSCSTVCFLKVEVALDLGRAYSRNAFERPAERRGIPLHNS